MFKWVFLVLMNVGSTSPVDFKDIILEPSTSL
jgi:hypothetical protein